MAKYRVKDYHLIVKPHPVATHVNILELSLTMTNNAGNSADRTYYIRADDNYSLDFIQKVLTDGLDYAKPLSSSIGISEFLERDYVNIDLYVTINSQREKRSFRFSTTKK